MGQDSEPNKLSHAQDMGGGRDVLLIQWGMMQDDWLSTWEEIK